MLVICVLNPAYQTPRFVACLSYLLRTGRTRHIELEAASAAVLRPGRGRTGRHQEEVKVQPGEPQLGRW